MLTCCIAPFLTALRRKYSDLKITAYVRSTSSDNEFSALNIGVVHGTFDELEKLTSLASEYDIVVNAASSLDPKLTSALVRGLSDKKGPKGILIHVSGVGNFADGGSSGSLNPESKTWNVSCQLSVFPRLSLKLVRMQVQKISARSMTKC